MDDLWISDLKFALQGQKHGRWETISNGVSGMAGEQPVFWWRAVSVEAAPDLAAAERKFGSDLRLQRRRRPFRRVYCFMDKQLGLGMVFLPRHSRKQSAV